MLCALLGLLLFAPPVTEVAASSATHRPYGGQEAVAVPVAPEPASEPSERSTPPSTPPPPAPLVTSAVPEETGLAPTSRPPGAGPTPRWWGPFPRPKVVAFIGPTLQFTRLNAAFAATVGLGGGAWIRERFGVGGAVLWLVNPIDAGKTTLGTAQRLNVNYGGPTPHASGERTNGEEHRMLGISPPAAPRSTSDFSSTIEVYCDIALSSELPLSTTSASYLRA